jgi:integrase
MKAAGIDRVGPTGEKRTFHSFRHSFAKVALEGGRPIAWLSRHLGHSSVSITDGVYGHAERASKKREVEAMAGVFGV